MNFNHERLKQSNIRMSATSGFQLLSLPKHMKENVLPQNNPQPTHRDELPFKFLSLPTASSLEKVPKLIMMPRMAPPLHNVPLLRRPNSSKVVAKRSGIACNRIGSPEKCTLPLLKKPTIPEQPILIKLPTARTGPEKKPVLIEIPIAQPQGTPVTPKEAPIWKQYPETDFIQSNVGRAFVATQPMLHVVPKKYSEYPEANLNQKNEVSGVDKNGNGVAEGIEQNSSQRTKRKRYQKRSESEHLVMGMKERVNETGNNITVSKTDSQQVSRETQTTGNSNRKVKDRKKRWNLFALLEKAALLENDLSSDEESILDYMKERSHLVEEELYSRAKPKSEDRHQIGQKRPTIEELLLQNFDDPCVTSARRSTGIAEPHSSSKSYVKESPHIPIQERRTIVNKTESSTQTFDDTQLPKFRIYDKPKSAAGPSWAEVIGISSSKQIVSADSTEKPLKEIGVQVSGHDPGVDKIEQMSQTDFTEEKDVAELLLKNLQDERLSKNQRNSGTAVRNDSSNGVTQYPWQYIADTDFSDVVVPRKELQQESYVRSQKMKPREDALLDASSDHPPGVRSPNVKETDKDVIALQSNRVNFPPELLLGMKVQDDRITTRFVDGDDRSRPLQVIDISRPISPLTEAEDGGKRIVIEDIPVERLKESVEADNQNLEAGWERLNDSVKGDIEKAHVLENRVEDMLHPKSLISDEFESAVASSMAVDQSDLKHRRSRVAAQSERFKKVVDSGPKDRLNTNLRNMSVQLDALDELYNQLEKEMKSSSMLMNFVETVHHGFFEEPEVFKRISTRQNNDLEPSLAYKKELTDRNSLLFAGKVELTDIIDSDVEESQAEVKFTEKSASVCEEDVARSKQDRDSQCKEFNSMRSDSLNENVQKDEEGIPLHDHSPRSDESRDGLEHVDMTFDNGQISSATPRNSHQDGGSTPGVTEEDQIRNRIARKFPTISKKRLEEDKASAELNLKQKLENKRKALQAWMKKKRSEQNRMYLKEIEEKRQKECRPFAGAKSASIATGGQQFKPHTGKMNRRQQVIDETYQERIDGAQQLLSDLFAVRSDAVSVEKSARPILSQVTKKKPVGFRGQKSFAKLKRKMADVYGKGISKSRKPGVRTNRALHKGIYGSDAGQMLMNNISPSWKNADLEDYLRDISNTVDEAESELVSGELNLNLGPDFGYHEPYTSTARSGANRYKLDLAQLSGRGTPDLDSGKARSHRSHAGRDFITKKSMNDYRKKTARLIQDSIRDYGSAEIDNSFQERSGGSLGSKGFESTDFLTDQEKFLVDRIMNERKSNEESPIQESKRQRTKSPDVFLEESEDVNEILQHYGLLDEDIKQYGSEEMFNLLAEADALLDAESEGDRTGPEEVIDWNEVDDILNQN